MKWMPILRIRPKVTSRDENAGNTARFCDKVAGRSMGVDRNFPGGGQSRHFGYPFQVSDDATQTDVHKTLYPFYSTKKMPNVTEAVANSAPSKT